MIKTTEKTDETESDLGFKPGFPPNFDPGRAEKGLAQEDEPIFNQALKAALHSFPGATDAWCAFQERGGTDAELLKALGKIESCSGQVRGERWSYKGSKSPKFSFQGEFGLQSFIGRRLVAKVREVMAIGAPGAVADPFCTDCGHVHVALGCSEDDCNCKEFRAAAMPNAQQELGQKLPFIVIEPVAEGKSGESARDMDPWPYLGDEEDEDEDEDDGGTPFPTEYSQEEINRMAEYCAPDKIGEEKPVKICYVGGQPHVITGAMSGGGAKNWASVDAWSVLPIGNVGEENAKTYEQAVKSGVRGPGFYQNVKINCGSTKKPNWWVMVGEGQTFTVKRKAPKFDNPDPVAERLHEEARTFSEIMSSESDPDQEQFYEAGKSFLNGYHPQTLRMIPLDQIVPSLTNPRKHFDPVKLQELADSIIEHGLVEPILVRPIKQSYLLEDAFEIVAGERRWRAAKLAGLTRIEAKVRDLDDKAVLEIQFIENLQRADLSPIEEADGYKRLLDEHGYTADSLAGKLAKSKSYVYGRLKLCDLPAVALDAMARGDLPATVGELIGRLPSMEMRETFWDDHFSGYGSEWFEAPSFREVRETIERRYMRELKSAPWNKKDATLVRESGACATCPKMTGNNRAEYPDGRADMCADVPCFDRKLKAHYERQIEKAEKSGATVLSEKESEKLFNSDGDSSWLSHEGRRKYIELKDKPSGDKEDRSYKQLLEGHIEPVVAIDPLGKAHYLAPSAEAERVLKDRYKINARSSSNTDSYKASEKKRADEKKLRQATAAEIVTRTLNHLNGNPFSEEGFVRLVAKLLIDKGSADVARAIAKRREVEYDTNNVRGSVEKIVNGLDDTDVPGLIVEWLLQRELEYWAQWGSESDKHILCEYFGLKRQAVMKEVSAKLKSEAKEKKKPAPKVKAVTTG